MCELFACYLYLPNNSEDISSVESLLIAVFHLFVQGLKSQFNKYREASKTQENVGKQFIRPATYLLRSNCWLARFCQVLKRKKNIE